ncbi:MAG TPA: nucleotidyl transferase AbiEii/AbiGii toxin family protein [Solirubrobacterales bacterium]|nr:nucleotidyl transferase AbiEii/AbiGii toxin family protein [Solirubrobacterales bacterium]
MAVDSLFDLPEDIDDQIEALITGHPTLTLDRVVRDIARIHCLLHLVEVGVLGDEAVLTGGMAMRCYNSQRFSVYDSDTSSIPVVSDEQLLRALNYEDDDLRVSISTIKPEDHGKDLVSAHPVEFESFFTGLEVEDTTFKVTVSNRGVERAAEWLPLRTGYPFPLWDSTKKYHLPVMARNELLAEKIVAWWPFAPAKHYADIAYLGALLGADGLASDQATRDDLCGLIEKKLDANKGVSREHKKRVEALTPDAQKDRLANPEKYLSPQQPFSKLAFFTPTPPAADRMKAGVQRWVVPLLFD